MQYAVQDGADGGRNGGCDHAKSRVNSWPCPRRNTEGGNPGWRIGTFLLRTRNLANLRENPPSQVFGRSAKLWGYRARGRSISCVIAACAASRYVVAVPRTRELLDFIPS